MDLLAALRLFVRVVERSSISGAGRSLGLSATAASRQVQELEAKLRARLLQRTTRSVVPTEAGRLLFERAGPLLDELDGVLRQAGDLHREPSGLLRVVVRRSFGLLHVVPAVAGFRAAYPRVDVELVLTETMDLLPNSGADLVIRLGRPDEKSYEATCLASDRRVLCASPAYLARVPVPTDPGDLGRHDCLTYRREYEPTVWVFEDQDRRREVAVTGPLRSNSGEVLRQAALDGLGLVLLPDWMVRHDVAAGRLVPCLPGCRAFPVGYQAEIYAVHARGGAVPAKVSAFVTHLRIAMTPFSSRE